MADVLLRNVVKRYGNYEAVRGINLEIPDTKFVALVGPSGCGKTTTLRMIAGLEDISEGDICIGGRVINDVAPKNRDIAMVFQSYALYPHMTVFQNMAFGLRMRGMAKADIRKNVEDAARILDISELLGRRPKALSGGQRQRVAMGRAIVRNPKVFLFDEPLSNLDAKLRVQMRTEIKRVHQQVKTTTIYVTHDQIEAMTLADTVVVMNRGRIEQAGTPHELYHSPKTRFVAGFMGSPAMNFLPCTLEQNAAALTVRLADGVGFPVPESICSAIRAGRKAAAVRHPSRTHHRTARFGARHVFGILDRAGCGGTDGHRDHGVFQARRRSRVRADRFRHVGAGLRRKGAAGRQYGAYASDRSRDRRGDLNSGAMTQEQ